MNSQNSNFTSQRLNHPVHLLLDLLVPVPQLHGLERGLRRGDVREDAALLRARGQAAEVAVEQVLKRSVILISAKGKERLLPPW